MQETTPTWAKLAITAGGVILAVAANATIHKSGGYHSADALTTLALAAGVFTGALVMGRAFAVKTGLGLALCAALVAGEAYQFATTGEQTMMARDAQSAPLKTKQTQRQQALEHLAALETATPSTQRLNLAKQALAEAKAGNEGTRVKIARAALEAAKQDVKDEAANEGCRKECKRKQALADAAEAALATAITLDAKDMGSRVASAEAELQAALQDADAVHAKAISDAKATVEANPVPPSANRLADATGLDPDYLDLLLAAARSVAINGLAGVLVAIGASAVAGGQPKRQEESAVPAAGYRQPATGNGTISEFETVPNSDSSQQTPFQVPLGSTGTDARAFIGGPVPVPVPYWGRGVPVGTVSVPPNGPNGSGPKGGTRKARSEPQIAANLIAKELRDRGEVPTLTVVRNAYRQRHGAELPKVTAHRAVNHA